MSVKRTRNAVKVRLAELEPSSFVELRGWLLGEIAGGARIVSLFGMSPAADAPLELVAVLAHDQDAELSLARSELPDHFESLTPEAPQAHWFERELAEQWGVVPDGHPWLKPIRFARAFRQAARCMGTERRGLSRGRRDRLLPRAR